MERASAFAPGSVSGVFKIVPDADPARMHSLGLGFTIREGVVVTVTHADHAEVCFNGQAMRFPTVAAVLARFEADHLRVEIESPLPLSCGFGLSGGSALAAAHAANALLGLGRTAEELAMAAHVAEVENLTGLGDVCAQHHGGCLVKLHPGSPLHAQVLPVEEQPVYFQYFEPIPTREVLSDPEKRRRINRAAAAALVRLGELAAQPAVDFAECVRVSRRFAVDSQLLQHPQVHRVVEQVESEGGAASMIMLGHAVFSTRPFAGAQETRLTRRHVEVV